MQERTYYVVVRSCRDDEEVHRVGPINSKRHAEKVESGMDRNLNHDEFYTTIVEDTG